MTFSRLFLYQGSFRLSPEKKTVSLHPKKIINTLRKAIQRLDTQNGLEMERQKTPFKHGTNVGISDFCAFYVLARSTPQRRNRSHHQFRQFRRVKRRRSSSAARSSSAWRSAWIWIRRLFFHHLWRKGVVFRDKICKLSLFPHKKQGFPALMFLLRKVSFFKKQDIFKSLKLNEVCKE